MQGRVTLGDLIRKSAAQPLMMQPGALGMAAGMMAPQGAIASAAMAPAQDQKMAQMRAWLESLVRGEGG